MWEGTLADVGLAITTTRSSPWLVLPTLGDEPINREGLAPQSGSIRLIGAVTPQDPLKKKKQTIGWLSLANFYSVSQ